MLRGLLRKLNSVFTGRKIDEDLWIELEETMVLSDIGVSTTARVLLELKAMVAKNQCRNVEEVKEYLRFELLRLLGVEPARLQTTGDMPLTWLILGVNGTGKTTTIGKLAYWLKRRGLRPLLVAADTFRAAAIEQLQEWGQRADVPVFSHQQNADPAAVTFDAIQSAKARGYDVILVDTAGRLHTKVNLMEELRKIAKVVERAQGRPPDESLLVLDASTGQNGLVQAQTFIGVVPVTGIILTKLDGTAKGGVVLTIRDTLQIPIKMVGTGERIEHLEAFEPRKFVDAIFAE